MYSHYVLQEKDYFMEYKREGSRKCLERYYLKVFKCKYCGMLYGVDDPEKDNGICPLCDLK